MARLELEEREISISQSALDRRDGGGEWYLWTNDNYWHRRLQAIGAEVVEETESGTRYKLAQRQVLLRKVPAARQGPRRIEFLQRKKSKAERTAVHISAERPAA